MSDETEITYILSQLCNTTYVLIFLPVTVLKRINWVFFDFSLSVKAAPHECVIRTGQP